jgi:hypothetical protein
MPHRGGLLHALAVLSAFFAFLSCCGGLTSPLGLALAIPVWVMASRDLAQMNHGLIDPSGKATTKDARNGAICAIVFSAVFFFLWGWVWLVDSQWWVLAGIWNGVSLYWRSAIRS